MLENDLSSQLVLHSILKNELSSILFMLSMLKNHHDQNPHQEEDQEKQCHREKG